MNKKVGKVQAKNEKSGKKYNGRMEKCNPRNKKQTCGKTREFEGNEGLSRETITF